MEDGKNGKTRALRDYPGVQCASGDGNPRGQIIAQASRDKDEVLMADLNLDEIAEVRRTWQFYRDRRPDLYGPLVEA